MSTNALLWLFLLIIFMALIMFAVRKRMRLFAVVKLFFQRSPRRTKRIRVSPRLLHLLRALLRTDEPLPALSLLQQHGRDLAVSIIKAQEATRRLPRLPADASGQVRMLALCRAMLQEEHPLSTALMLEKLDAWSNLSPVTWRERDSLPAVAAACVCDNLLHTLDELKADVRAHAHGRRLAHRLMHARKPLRMLLRTARPELTGAWALVHTLRHAQQHEILGHIDTLLSQADLSAGELFDRHARQQALFSQRIEQAASQLQYLARIDWQSVCEPGDPLHAVLAEDPDGAYSRMDAPSRRAYRSQAALLAHRYGVDEIRLARCCVHLAHKAQDDPPHNHIGLYLMEYEGQILLRRALPASRGGLLTWLHGRTALLTRICAAIVSSCISLACMIAGLPLSVIPLLICVQSAAVYPLLQLLLQHAFPPVPPVRIALERIDDRVRTLIVLPAMLHDASDAISCVRTLLTVRESCPRSAIDCLLIGDFEPNITRQSALDATIITAATQAVSALDEVDMRFFYLQRQRVWDEAKRIFTAQDGPNGAMECITKLTAAQGSTDFAATTVTPVELTGRYAYVLQIDRSTVLPPDMLIDLIGMMEHPLYVQQETTHGKRGIGVLQIPCRARADAAVTMFSRLAAVNNDYSLLYRPDAVQEAAHTMDVPAVPALHAIQAATGCRTSVNASGYTVGINAIAAHMHAVWQQTYAVSRSWALALPGTPAVPAGAHLSMRRRFVAMLLPACRLLLLTCAVALRLPVLFMLALFLPSLAPSQRSLTGLLYSVCTLPQQAAVRLHALYRALRDMLAHRSNTIGTPPAENTMQRLEQWSQGISAALITTLSLLTRPPHWGGLLLGAGFAAFPLVHIWLDSPAPSASQPDVDAQAFLTESAQATWRYFTTHIGADTRHLPPCYVQDQPLRPDTHTSPRAVAMYLLACVAATDLRLCTINDAAGRIQAAASSLETFPRWHGLYYASYRLDHPAAAADVIPAAENGLLCAALMLAAQAMRTHLPQLDAPFHTLPAALDELAAAMQLARLYDAAAGLFHTAVTDRGVPSGEWHTLHTSEAMVLSFIAVMRRDVPAAHWQQTDRTRVRTRYGATPLSRHGDLSAYLLSALLLPCLPASDWWDSALSAIRLQLHCGKAPLFGYSSAASPESFPLRRHSTPFGVDLLATHRSNGTTVVAPYAAAMALPFEPQEAVHCLTHLARMGMSTSCGYYDSVDLSPGNGEAFSISPCYDSAHQAAFLCAICNALTGGIAQYIASLPSAVSTLSLLLADAHAPTIAPIEVLAQSYAQQHRDVFRDAEPLFLPPDACLLGSDEASVLTDSQLSGVLMGHGLYLTRFSEAAGERDGIRFAFSDGRKTVALGCGMKPVFHTGYAEYKCTVGRVDICLTVLVDPITHIIWHLVDLHSKAASERILTITDLLLPALTEDPGVLPSLTIDTPASQLITAAAPDEPLRLCHAAISDCEGISVHAITNCSDLVLQDRKTAALLHTPHGETPCMGFNLQLRLPGRTKARIGLATYTHAWPASRQLPVLPVENHASVLAQLHAHIQLDALGINPEESLILQRLTGTLFYTGLPHQGADNPLQTPPSHLCGYGVDLHKPLLLLLVSTADCALIVAQCCRAAALLEALGHPITLCVLATGSNESHARRVAKESIRTAVPDGTPPDVICHAAHSMPEDVRETLTAFARLTLHDGEALESQLRALRVALQTNSFSHTPVTHCTLTEVLDYPQCSGGFSPAVQDYIQYCTPEAVPAARWARTLPGYQLGTQTCMEGVLQTSPLTADTTVDTHLAEVYYLEEDGARFSPTPYPYGGACSIRAQHSPGATVWHATGHDCELRLTVCNLPDRPVSMRVLRIHNLSNTARNINVTAAVHFKNSHACTALTALDNCITAQHPASANLSFFCAVAAPATPRRAPYSLYLQDLALGASRISEGNMPDVLRGCVGSLDSTITLEANGSCTISYLLGSADTTDEIETILAYIQTQGISALARATQQHWARQMHAQSLVSPAEDFSLLINRLLPMSFLSAAPGYSSLQGIAHAAPRVYTAPEMMRNAILHMALHLPKDPRQRLALPLCTAWYIKRTGDVALLDETAAETTLGNCCTATLASLRLGVGDLPSRHGQSDVLSGLIFLAALHAYLPYVPVEDQPQLTMLDDAVTQAILRCDSLTPDCLHTCWMLIAGLIDTLPIGIEPTNTAEAICYLHALCLSGEYDAAFQLISWMNPALNRPPACAPWQLDADTDAAALYAAWLYVLILEQLLGVDKQGNAVRIEPHIPADWSDFSLTLHIGSSTWQIDAARDVHATTVDGVVQPVDAFFLSEDGGRHHVRVPILAPSTADASILEGDSMPEEHVLS